MILYLKAQIFKRVSEGLLDHVKASKDTFWGNVPADKLDEVIAVLPCMREPTIASLHGSEGFAVKAAVARDRVPDLIPLLRARGGSDILVAELAQLIP